MKKVFIVHCWEGHPEDGWYPWLKKELENRGFKVVVPEMPNTDEPVFSEWLAYLQRIASDPDENTYFVGHSLGCVTILRYLEKLEPEAKVGGVVLVAGFPQDIGYNEIESFLEAPVDFEKIKTHTDKFVAIHSDNDPYVSLENGKIFEQKLGAELIILKGMKHFSGSEGTTELPKALESVLKLAG